MIASHVRTSTGKYMPQDLVWYATNEAMVSNIPLEKIGITKQWVVNEDYKKLKTNHNIHIESTNIVRVINAADQNKLTQWIKGLGNAQYADFIKLVIPFANDITKQVYRSNLGNVYSWQQLSSIDNVYFTYREEDKQFFAIFPKVEYVTASFSSINSYSQQMYWSCIYEKLNYNIKFFADDAAGQNCACALLKGMCAYNSNLFEGKVKEIALLKNVRGERIAFRQLFTERPLDTILYDEFVAQQPLPTNAQKDWFANKKQL